MQKNFFLSACFYGIFFCMTFFLSSCTLLDNAKIDNANRWVKAIAADNGCAYLDTQSILKDQNNCLKEEYCNSSDGIHLGKNAYEAILQYIRTHAVP